MKTSNKARHPQGNLIGLNVPAWVNPTTDLAAKVNAPVDSWFVIGYLQAEQGRKLNFVLHQISFARPGKDPLLQCILNVTDLTTGWYRAEEKIYPVSEVNISTTKLDNRMPTAKLFGDMKRMSLHATMPDATLDMTLRPRGRVLYNCGTGMFPFLGIPTYQYSLPSISTKGTMVLGTRTFQVSGESWFDRQWSVFGSVGSKDRVSTHLRSPDYRWTWMDLNLDNGDALSLWDIIYPRKEYAFATVLQPDGTHTVVNVTPLARDASDFWSSPKSGQRYPTRWVVRIPALDSSLEVIPNPREQEILSSFIPKYEGAANVNGTYRGQKVTGYTLIEMVGVWK